MRPSEAAYLLLFLPVYIEKEAKQSPLAQETNPFLLSQGQIQKRHPGLGWGLPLALIFQPLSRDFWDPAGALMQR